MSQKEEKEQAKAVRDALIATVEAQLLSRKDGAATSVSATELRDMIAASVDQQLDQQKHTDKTGVDDLLRQLQRWSDYYARQNARPRPPTDHHPHSD